MNPESKIQHPKYQRVLLKLSGEALVGEQAYGIDNTVLRQFAREVQAAHELGVQLSIVIGGGNIFRGVQNATDGMNRAHADYMGMLATMINGMALQDALEQAGMHTRLQSSIQMDEIAEPFIRRRAIRHLEKGRVVIFGAGTGAPFFTTDTAAALRALEVEADVLLKGTKVDGIFSADPVENPDAEHFDRIHGNDVIQRNLRVMDMTAFTMCRESKMPIVVFNMHREGALRRVLQGEPLGTLVHWQEAEASVAPHS